MAKIKVTTASGFKASIDSDVLNDMEILEALIVAEDPNVTDPIEKLKASMLITKKIYGEKGKDGLYDHIKKSNNGRVPAEALMAEIKSTIDALGEAGKKS